MSVAFGDVVGSVSGFVVGLSVGFGDAVGSSPSGHLPSPVTVKVIQISSPLLIGIISSHNASC